MSELPQILSFYSFKGGVGRSMALLNLAYALVAKGRNVLVLDMDLEAPGLSGFMSRQKEIAALARHDMLDLLLWAKQTAQNVSEDARLNASSLPPLSDYAVRVPSEKLVSLPNKLRDVGRLEVIAIDETRNYYDRLSEVAVAGMDRDTLLRVGSLLRAWLKSRRIPLDVPDYYGPVPDEERSAPFDYVLIDSRTGITEVGGLCIGPLSDQLVVLCGLNDQNIEGTRQFLTEVGVLRSSSDAPPSTVKPTLFVASPIPIGEMTTKSERIERLKTALGPINPKLFKLTYHPQMALMETIFVRDHEDELLTQEYRTILTELLERAGANSALKRSTFFESIRAKEPLTDQTRGSVRALLRSASASEMALLLFYAIVADRDLKTVRDDIDFQLFDRICSAVVSSESAVQFRALGRWSDILSEWALRSTDPALAARRFEEAIDRLDRIIDSPKTTPEGRAIALFNRGLTFGQQGNPEREIADYTAVIEMPDAPVKEKIQALVNRGVTFGQLGDPKRAIADYTAVIEMPNAPAEEKSRALVNRGIAFGREDSLDRAIADYTTVIEMPKVPAAQKSQALHNRGVTFGQQGNPEREIADYNAVIEMPDSPTEQKAKAMINRSWHCFMVGRIKEAIADSRQAVALNSKDVDAIGNLAISLLVDHETSEAIATYDSAIELADTDGLALLEKELAEAIDRYGTLPGADEVRARIEARVKKS